MMMLGHLDQKVTVELTRAQCMLLDEIFQVADRYLRLSEYLGGGHRLRSARTGIKKIKAAIK